ncbi:hypothetical protein FRC11_011717 [Ceratobasidium sp. 423]|nr:hypothetical protein FRC11_011717 [Ceratobasidium sp. 423]
MSIVLALHQKVLGIREQFAFGVFQFKRYFLQVVAGIWQDDEMKLHTVATRSESHYR